MQDFSGISRVPYLQPSGTYDGVNRMLVMPEEQLERMYPQIYYIVNPIIIRQCDIMDGAYGTSYIPTREELENITDNIVSEVDGRVNVEMPQGNNNPNGNPNGDPRGNPFLRGLVGTLLIRELLGRRRHRPFRRFHDVYPGFYPYPIYPGFYPGFYPGYF